MRTPVEAMLWESWRLTRVEMAFRMSLAFILGGAPLIAIGLVVAFGDQDPANMARLMNGGATVTLFLLSFLAVPFWFSIALLKGGRPIDGGTPGFSFSHGYPRPVTTGLLVGVPLTYLAVANAALYVVPALVLGALFGYAFPLAPFATWLVVFSLVQATTNWWTRSKTVQLVSSMAAVGACMLLVFRQVEAAAARGDIRDPGFRPAEWPALFALSLSDYGLIGSIAVASVALAIVSVARQRHGDGLIPVDGVAGAAWLHRWHVDVFRFPCPISTPARAQYWFEAKRTGAPLLTVGVGLALAIPALLAAVEPWKAAQMFAFTPAMLAPFVVLRMGIDNVFGLQRKPGRTYASTFDARQAIGTLTLVTLKVLVRTSSFIFALAALGVSYWWSVPLLDGWSTILPSNYAALTGGRRAVAAAMEALTGPQRAALAAVIVAGVAATVAHVASLQVLRLLHPNRVYAGILALLAYTLTFLILSSGMTSGLASALAQTYPWVIAAAISLTTIHAFRLALMERLLTAWHAVGAVLLWTICVVSWLMLTQGHLDVSEMPSASIALMLSLNLLPATAIALTPWAYSLIRHQ
jgi:hypothetical protein